MGTVLLCLRSKKRKEGKPVTQSKEAGARSAWGSTDHGQECERSPNSAEV